MIKDRWLYPTVFWLEDTLADKAALERTGMSAEERARIVTDAYELSDSPAAFRAALEEHNLLLAKGDRRAFVIVDSAGQVHSLSRHVKGVKSKEIARKLEGLDVSSLPSVEQAKAEYHPAGGQPLFQVQP